MFKWFYKLQIKSFLKAVREIVDKVLTNGEKVNRGQTDNHFPSSEEIEKQTEYMRNAKKEKVKEEKKRAHDILKGNR